MRTFLRMAEHHVSLILVRRRLGMLGRQAAFRGVMVLLCRKFPAQHRAVNFFQMGLQDFTPEPQRCVLVLLASSSSVICHRDGI